MKKLFLLPLIAIAIFIASAMGQQNNRCALVVMAEVMNIEGHPIGPPSGIVASYRFASYSVIEVIKGQFAKKKINVAHLILTGNELEELRVGDKVLLCLNKPQNVFHKKGRTISWDMRGADYEGELLLVDSGRR
jgi:hypothetical protein